MKQLLGLILLINTTVGVGQRGSLPLELKPFYHGVASGDPLANSVILWTRVTPDNFIPGDSIEVAWRICTDTAMTQVVNSGTLYTDETKDFTVKVDASGLSPYTCYYYDFAAFDTYSVRGRTRTAPAGDADSVRFAVVSCSNYEHGYFNSYRLIHNRNDVDVILHLGDYIYEYEQGGYSSNISGRDHQPTTEIIQLDDYRTRYSHYRLDDDLRDLHQQFPFITIWDDHESANDSYKDGAENHSPGSEGSWVNRKANAKQAYFEWMPVRDNSQSAQRLYRAFSFGNLIKLCMLDTRLEGRSEQVSATSSDVNSSSRTILGVTQYDWLIDQLDTSSAKWNILGQQVMMAPLEMAGLPLNADQWDGYAFERNKLFNDILIKGIENIVVLTGDIHTSWANDLPISGYDPNTGANSIGTEFVVTSVTSPGFPISFGTSVIQAANDHMKWIDLTKHGYLILDVNKTRVQGEWYFVDDVTVPSTNESLGNAFYVGDNDNHLTQSAVVSQRESLPCTMAPELPIPTVVSLEEQQGHTIIGLYPNPAQSEVLLQLHVAESMEGQLELLNMEGKVITKINVLLQNGLNYARFDLTWLSAGMYLVRVNTKTGVTNQLFVKQ